MRFSLFARYPNRLRMRIRTLMLLVVIIAVAIEAHMLWRKRQEYLWYRDFYADNEEYWRKSAEEHVALAGGAQFIQAHEELIEEANHWKAEEALERVNAQLAQGLAEFNARMKAKYDYAASHPWIAVPPDPPEPPWPH